MKDFIESPHPVARVSFGDVFTTEREQGLLVHAHGQDIGAREWMMPICRWLPGGVIDKARYMVIGYFKERSKQAIATKEGAWGGPREPQAISSEKAFAKALTNIYDRDAAVPLRDEVCAVLKGLGISGRAAKRVWESAGTPNWKAKGRRAETKKMPLEAFKRLLGSELGIETPSQT